MPVRVPKGIWDQLSSVGCTVYLGYTLSWSKVFDVWVDYSSTLQGIAAKTDRAWNLRKLLARDAFIRRQVISWSRHL